MQITRIVKIGIDTEMGTAFRYELRAARPEAERSRYAPKTFATGALVGLIYREAVALELAETLGLEIEKAHGVEHAERALAAHAAARS